MKIQALCPTQNSSCACATNLCKPQLAKTKVATNVLSEQLPAVSSLSALSQLPNVSFTAKKRNYGRDNFDPYYSYRGPQPPEIEMQKFNLSERIQQDIDDEDYLSAIKGKIILAKVCKSQDKEEDAFMLEESIRRLYKDLPKYQKQDAKDAIKEYNADMAKQIDKDIERY